MRHLMPSLCASSVMKVPDGFSSQVTQAGSVSAPYLGHGHWAAPPDSPGLLQPHLGVHLEVLRNLKTSICVPQCDTEQWFSDSWM